VRTWGITAFFPEVKPAHVATQSCCIEACSIATAAHRGLEAIYDREPIRRKHISIVKLTIVAAGRDKTKPEQA